MFRVTKFGFYMSPLTFTISFTLIPYEVPHPQGLFSLSIGPPWDIWLFSINLLFEKGIVVTENRDLGVCYEFINLDLIHFFFG